MPSGHAAATCRPSGRKATARYPPLVDGTVPQAPAGFDVPELQERPRVA